MGSSSGEDGVNAVPDGLAQWRKEQRQAAIERVAAFDAWLKADSALWARYHSGCITREERIAQQPQLPLGIPSDSDFVIAREAAAETAVAQ